jgi:tRNA threonylcarbamoyladenosine biosynthesis protein TsaB
MVALVLDTALHCAQAALFDGEHCLAGGMRKGERGQAEILLPLLEDVLKQAKLVWQDLTQVIVTVGPGVFTGIRVGIAAARALKLALDVPVFGVSTLHALVAMKVEKNKTVLSLLDAHKDETYAQLFSWDLKTLSEPMLLKCGELAPYIKEAGQIVAYPPLFAKNHEQLKGAKTYDRLDLQAVLRCSEVAPLEPLPLYVRAPDALPQKSVLLRRA